MPNTIRKLLLTLISALAFSVDIAHAAILTTAVNTDGGCEGVFFDVTAKTEAVRILELRSVVVGTDNVSVYYKAGGHGGFEQTPAAWTLLNTAPVVGGAGFIQSLYPVGVGAGVTIPAGQTYGFLVWIDNAAGPGVKAIRYNTSGVVDTTEDASIRIVSGASSCGGSVNNPFDGVSNVRSWRGGVIYSVMMQSIPTLSDHGLIALFVLLAVSTVYSLRRRPG